MRTALSFNLPYKESLGRIKNFMQYQYFYIQLVNKKYINRK